MHYKYVICKSLLRVMLGSSRSKALYLYLFERFSNAQDLYENGHNGVSAGLEFRKNQLKSGWTKFEFDFDIGANDKSINIDYAMKLSHSNEIVQHFCDDFQGVVRTVVKIKEGEMPQIVTIFPKLSAAQQKIL